MRFGDAYDPIRSLKTTWSLVKQAPLSTLIGGLLLALFSGGGGGGGANFGNISQHHDGSSSIDWSVLLPIVLGILGIVLCVVIVCFLVSSWLLPGFARAIQHSLRTGSDDIARVFDASGRFVPVMLTRLLGLAISLLISLPFVAVTVVAFLIANTHRHADGAVVLLAVLAALAYLPIFIYLSLGLSLMQPIAAVEEATPSQALKRSWEIAHGNRWQLIWFFLFTGIFGAIGVCACCIGVFLTMPMAQVMQIEAYLALTRGDQYSSWWIGRGGFLEHHPQGWGSDPANLSSAPPIASAPSIPVAPQAPPQPPPPAPPPPAS